MSESKTKPAETPAALRERRRRQPLQELKASTVDVMLTEEQGQRLETLLTAGYAPDKSSVLAKSPDEAFEREIKPQSGTKAKK